MPDDFLIQTHWGPADAFRAQLAGSGFKVLTCARHPLDVYRLSILHFCRHEPATARWLDGAGGDEQLLAKAAPLDQAVRDCARGQRFRALLEVTESRWELADVAVRYEDLVADTTAELSRIVAALDLNETV